MPIRKIVTIPEPVLRQKARKVTDFGPALQTIVDDMIETMRDAPGVGLAAPQVDIPLRVIVIEYGEDEEKEIPPKLYTVINPEITRLAPESEVGTEGCLSIPGYIGDVNRPLGITIRGQNRHGQPIKIKAEGWLARIFQHELDHLDGVLFIDRADKVWEYTGEPGQAVPLD